MFSLCYARSQSIEIAIIVESGFPPGWPTFSMTALAAAPMLPGSEASRLSSSRFARLPKSSAAFDSCFPIRGRLPAAIGSRAISSGTASLPAAAAPHSLLWLFFQDCLPVLLDACDTAADADSDTATNQP